MAWPSLSVRSLDLVEVAWGGAAVLALLSVGLVLLALGHHLWSRVQDRARTERRTRWRHHLLQILAGERTPRSLPDAVDRTEYDALADFLLPFATTVQGAAARRIRAVARACMPRLRRQLRARRPLIRARALQRIGLLGGSEQIRVLRSMLADPSERVVEIAFRWLARRGGPEDAPVLLDRIPQLSHVDRRRITSALVELGEDATPVLRDALAAPSRSPYVRVCCAEALRWLGDSGAAPVAAQQLQDTDLEATGTACEVNASLLRLLRRVGQPPHRPVVRRFCHSPTPYVRIHAARALGQIGLPDDETLLGRLVHDDDSRWVALNAAQSLTELGCTAPLRQLHRTGHRRAELASHVLDAPRS